MNESFELPVLYKGQQLHFEARLLVYGYSYKFNVHVNGQEILFESDEEGNYRAVVEYTQLEKYKALDTGLLQAIANGIEAISMY